MTTTEEELRRERVARPARLALLALSTALGSAGVALDRLGRGRTFFFDEWDFVLLRRSGFGDALLESHNGHLSIVPIAIYRTLFAVVGLDHYRPYRLAAIAAHLLVAALVAVLVRRAAGWWLAVPMAAAVAWLGSGWQNTLWPFQIGFMLSVAAGLGAHVLLADRRRDVWSCVLVGVALASSSVGLPMAIGVASRLACRRTDWRREWVVVAPGALWFAWYLAYGESQASSDNASVLASYVATSGAGAVAALGDLSLDWGRVLLGLGLGLWLAVVLRTRSVPPRMVGYAATALSFWVLTGISRGRLGEPVASRYVYVGAVLVLLLVAEAVPRAPRPWLTGTAVLVLGLGIWGNVSILRAGAGGLRSTSEIVGAELYAIELAAEEVHAGYYPDPARAPQVTAGVYLDAVADLGSPATDAGALAASSEEARANADRVLLEIYSPTVEASPASNAGASACDRVAAGDEVVLSSGGVVGVAESAVTLRLQLRRFADEPSALVLEVTGAGRVELPADGSEVPWRVRVVDGSGRLCAAR